MEKLAPAKTVDVGLPGRGEAGVETVRRAGRREDPEVFREDGVQAAPEPVRRYLWRPGGYVEVSDLPVRVDAGVGPSRADGRKMPSVEGRYRRLQLALDGPGRSAGTERLLRLPSFEEVPR